MVSYCRGCKYHHKAGHPKNTAMGRSKYNDWCIKFSGHAKKLIGHCKLNNGKELR